MRDYQASRELARIAPLAAFNVAGATKRQRLNQHATRYTFADGSCLLVRATASRGDAWHPEWKGTPSDIALGPLQGTPLRINRQGSRPC